MKYPERNAKPSELQIKLDNVVARLAEVEKDVTPRRSQVTLMSLFAYQYNSKLPDFVWLLLFVHNKLH